MELGSDRRARPRLFTALRRGLATARSRPLNGYIDASALVAVLGEERAGSDVRETFEAADSLASSPLTFVETHSALAASKLSGRMSPNAYAAAREAFARLWPGLDVVALDGSLAARAAEVVETHALRSHDAVQLASALALEDPTVVMITLDRRLRRAASDAGLGVAP